MKKFITRVVLIVLLGLLGCTFNEPLLPTWVLPFNIPLSRETFKMRELVNDSTIVVQGSDSLIFISVDGDIDPETIRPGDLSIKPEDRMQSITIDTLKLDSLQTLTTSFISLRELIPELSSIPTGQSVTIPDTTLIPTPEILKASDFKKIHLLQGKVTIRIRNNLPFAIGPNSTNPSGIEFTLLNDSLNQQIVQTSIMDTLFPGETGEGSDQIQDGGIWFYSRVRLEYRLPVAMETTLVVTDSLLDSVGFTIEIDLRSFEADEVVAQLEKQEFEGTIKFGFRSADKLRSGVVDRGAVRLDIDNHIPLNGKVVFTLSNVFTPQGQNFTDSIVVGQTPVSKILTLDNMTIGSPGNQDGFLDSIEVNITASTQSATEFIHIRSSDEIVVQVHTDSIFFKSFAGFLTEKTLDIGPFEQKDIADYGDIQGGVNLSDVSLTLQIFNEIFIENLIFDLTISGYHEDENGNATDSAKIVLVNQQIIPGHQGQPGITKIQLSGSEIANFLNILPTSLRGTGAVRVSGNAEVARDNRIWGTYSISTPLRLRIQGAPPIRGDVDTITVEDIDENIQDAAADDFQEADLRVKLSNHTPFGGRIRIIVSADSNHVDLYDTTYFNPAEEFIKTLQLSAAPTDPLTGFVTMPLESEIILGLNRQEMQLFSDPPLRVGIEVQIFDTQGEVVLRSMDYIKVAGMARIAVIVKDENQ